MPLHKLAVAREDAIALGHVIGPHRKHDHEVRLSDVRHAVSPLERYRASGDDKAWRGIRSSGSSTTRLDNAQGGQSPEPGVSRGRALVVVCWRDPMLRAARRVRPERGNGYLGRYPQRREIDIPSTPRAGGACGPQVVSRRLRRAANPAPRSVLAPRSTRSLASSN